MLQNGGAGGTTWVLAGALTIKADAATGSGNGCIFLTGNGPILVAASISGSGAICLGTSSAGNNGNNVILAGSLSGFTGSILTTDHHVTTPLTFSNATAQTVSGNISMLDLITKMGPGALTLSGSNTFSGGLTLSGLVSGAQLNINSTNALGAAASTFTISGGSSAIDNTSGGSITLLANNPQSWASDFTFVGSNPLNLGNGNVTLGATRNVTVSGSTLTVGGVISGTSFGITKNGAGTLTLNGANTYTGDTTVSGGTLALGSSGSIANSTNTIVASGAKFDVSAATYTLGASRTLGGSGNINGSVTDSSTSTILPGGSGTVGTLTFNNNLTFAGGDTLKFDFASTSNDVINVAGGVTLNGTTTINLASLPGGGLVNGNYTLIQATNNFSGTGGFTITGIPSPSRQTFTLVTNGSSPQKIVLQVGGAPAVLTWQPTNSVWDIVNTHNWFNNGNSSADIYFDGDSVNFTDSGSSISPVLNTNVQPGSVTFNSANAYILSGTGAINGGTGLTKTNSGTLTILIPTNNYTGVTYIGGGTVSVTNLANGGSASAIGAAGSAAASLVLDGGTLQYGGPTVSINRGATLNVGGGTVTVTNPAATLTLGGAIVGVSGGGITTAGSGTIIFSGANTYNGSTTVSAGTLQLTGSGIFGTGNVINNSTVVLNYAGTSAVTNNISGSGSVLLNGAGTVTLSGNNSFSGGVLATAGALSQTNSTGLGTGTLTLTNSLTQIALASGVTVTNPIVIGSPSGTFAGGLIKGPASGSATISGPITATVIAANGDTTLNGGVFDGGNTTGGLIINGPLSAPSGAGVHLRANRAVFSGGGSVTILRDSGIAVLGANNGLPTGATLQVGASGFAIFDLAGFNQTLAGLVLGGGGGSVTNSGGANATLTISGVSTNTTFTGSINDNGVNKIALTVTGGIFTLSGGNTYNGNTTISGGTLALSGSGSIANSPTIAIAAGATFDVSALSSAFTLAASQTLAASGTASAATINGTNSAGLGIISLTFDGSHPSLTQANGVLTLNTNGFTINNASGSPLSPGTYVVITTVTGGSVTGSVSTSTLNITGSGVLGTHQSSLAISGGTAVNLVVGNRAPVAGSSFTMDVVVGMPSIVQIVGGKYAPSDADGDALTVTGVIGETNGTATTDGTNITYTATNGTADSFTYTVSDGYGGSATQTVSVVISTPTAQAPNQVSATAVGGNAVLNYAGIPGRNYALDETHSLSLPIAWTPVVTNMAATNGVIGSLVFTNPISGGSDFYRTRSVP